MSKTIDDFVVEQVFHKLVNEFGEVSYWRETADGEGYIVWWPEYEDSHLHTYYYPPDVWGSNG